MLAVDSVYEYRSQRMFTITSGKLGPMFTNGSSGLQICAEWCFKLYRISNYYFGFLSKLFGTMLERFRTPFQLALCELVLLGLKLEVSCRDAFLYPYWNFVRYLYSTYRLWASKHLSDLDESTLVSIWSLNFLTLVRNRGVIHVILFIFHQIFSPISNRQEINSTPCFRGAQTDSWYGRISRTAYIFQTILLTLPIPYPTGQTTEFNGRASQWPQTWGILIEASTDLPRQGQRGERWPCHESHS